MWIEKLAIGVVRLITPIGPRFIELSFWQRAYFLWIFRHFDTLPQQVLSERQQKIIDQLCVEKRFISLPSTMDDVPVIGTLERIPVMQAEESTAPAHRIADPNSVPLASDAHPRS